MADGETAEVGGGLEVDRQRPLPLRVPSLLISKIGDALVNARIVDEHVDAAEPPERGLPDPPWRGWIGEIASEQLFAPAGGMAGDIVAGGLEEVVGRRPDAAARSGDEDVHGGPLSSPAFAGEGDQRSWWRGPSVNPSDYHLPSKSRGRRARRRCR